MEISNRVSSCKCHFSSHLRRTRLVFHHNCLASTWVINNRTLCAVRFPLNLVQNHDLQSSRETVRSFTNCSRSKTIRGAKNLFVIAFVFIRRESPFYFSLAWEPELHILSSNPIASANWWMTRKMKLICRADFLFGGEKRLSQFLLANQTEWVTNKLKTDWFA